MCVFFLLSILTFSLQTYARDSHFFSKVTRNYDEDTSPTTTTTSPNTNKFFMNNKENEQFESLSKKQEQEPTFMPQTTGASNGLYGHEIDLHHDKNYAPELKGLSTTSYSTNVAPTKFNNNNEFDESRYNGAKNGKYYYDGLNSEEHYDSNNNHNNFNNSNYGARRYNGMHEKQGMSDTRFLENGKYYYDLNNEANYNPNNNYMSNSNTFNKNYETNGYYGNKETNYGNNNNNFHGNGMMKGYQNRIPEDERFDFDDQP
ncbi:Protein E6 [Bienertia sinuspersici]